MTSCPMSKHHSDPSLPDHIPAKCPVAHGSDAVNPLNNVPLSLSQSPTPSQQTILSTKRKISSIPRAISSDEASDSLNQSSSSNWVYPSPQQFFNALSRKGYQMPEDQMAAMVQLHNFLNEEAWIEVLEWERRLNPNSTSAPQLAQISGKPKELTYKARAIQWASWMMPSRFPQRRPFDRHDWMVLRETGELIRYVIDYYKDEPDEEGNPAFLLDVRPASDSLSSIQAKGKRMIVELWSSFGASEKPSKDTSS
ncbi:holocytochrome c synthase [Tulasnella sp. 427]|nr:holocytochrome c synthase [Tulasnella sp. 427]